MVAAIGKIPGLDVAGITTFPALLFDDDKQAVVPDHNLSTLERTAASCARPAWQGSRSTHPAPVVVLQTLADAGATQVEPGNGLTGTTPLHAVRDLPESALIPPPAMIDYYGQLDAADHPSIRIGDSVVLGLRPQIFFTRASVAPVSGISSGGAKVEDIWTSDGRPASRPAAG